MAGHSAHDAAEYVPQNLKRQWAKKDPIARFEKYLLARRILTRGRIQEMETGIRKEIEDAVAEAESSPLPEARESEEGIYCQSPCWWEQARESCPS